MPADDPFDRYQRQIIFPGLGKDGQERLSRAAVVQVGCGGLGSTLAQCLVRAGVKKYTIIDKDQAEITNLHRQFLFDEDDARKSAKKAHVAARKLKKADSGVIIRGIAAELTAANAEKLLAGHDLVLDGLDNMLTRYVINDYCVKNRVPWIYGGVVGASGMTMVVLPHDGPCLRCLFPEPDPTLPTTVTAGIINTAPTLVAALQATEAIKFLIQSPDLIRDLRILDLWNGEYQSIPVRQNPECPCCGQGKFEFLADSRS